MVGLTGYTLLTYGCWAGDGNGTKSEAFMFMKIVLMKGEFNIEITMCLSVVNNL